MLKHSTIPRQVGFTLIELMIVIVITAILLALAVPAFQDTLDRNRLKAATDTIYGDLQFAKSEAIKKNQPLLIDFKSINGTSAWCYGLKLNATSCDCEQTDPSNSNACTIDGVLKVVKYTDYSGVSLAFNKDFKFDNVRGTIKGQDNDNPCVEDSSLPDNCIVTLTSARNKQTRLISSGIGRIRACSPAGNNNVPGYSTSCP